jgi:ribonuclease BN (tRNA processing enzyme)
MIGQFNPVLVNTGTDLILFDTGNGPEGREFGTGQLASRIAASGYASSDVTIVAISHLHTDHINGLMDGGRPAFSHARYVVGQAEWAFWNSTDFTGTPAAMHAAAIQRKVLPLREKLAFISAAASIAPGVTSMVAAGPTRSHDVPTGIGRAQPAAHRRYGNHFVASRQKPDWEVSFHMDKGAAASSRRRIFDMLAAEKIPFYRLSHASSVGRLCRDVGYGLRFVPVSYQFLI